MADADLEWVMLASSSNSGTPPKLPSSAFPSRVHRYAGTPKTNYSRVAQASSSENNQSLEVPESIASSDMSTMELGATAATEALRVIDPYINKKLKTSSY